MKTCILIIMIFLYSSIVSASKVKQSDISKNRIKKYLVQENDSLMRIAFKIYGDYRKWKDLVKLNPNLERDNYNLKGVRTINFEIPNKYFKWEPLGEPYLVKEKDTLGTIANKVYQNPKKWADIYNNNLPLIRDPNLIFSGFTLYYIPN